MRSGAAQALGEDEAESDGWDAGDRSDLRRAIQFRSAPENKEINEGQSRHVLNIQSNQRSR